MTTKVVSGGDPSHTRSMSIKVVPSKAGRFFFGSFARWGPFWYIKSWRVQDSVIKTRPPPPSTVDSRGEPQRLKMCRGATCRGSRLSKDPRCRRFSTPPSPSDRGSSPPSTSAAISEIWRLLYLSIVHNGASRRCLRPRHESETDWVNCPSTTTTLPDLEYAGLRRGESADEEVRRPSALRQRG